MTTKKWFKYNNALRDSRWHGTSKRMSKRASSKEQGRVFVSLERDFNPQFVRNYNR
jgi:hypothetical protein